MNTTQVQLAQPQYEITEEDRKRVERIEAARKAYEGDFEKPLVPMEGQPDDNVITNEMAGIIDRGGDFLFGKELEISVEEGAPKEAQDFLNDIWEEKEKRIPLLLRLHMNGAWSGRAFLRIVPGRQQGTFRLVEIDPCTVFVKTAPQDCQTVLLYCIQYGTDGKDENGKPCKIYYREEITRIDPEYIDDSQEDALASGIDQNVTWQIQHWTQKMSNTTMLPKNEGWIPAGDPYIWPYPFAPIQSCQNLPKPNDFWGYPDLMINLIHINEALNLDQSFVQRLGKILSSPIITASGMGESIIDVKPGKIVELPLTDSKIASVPIPSDLPSLLAFIADLRSSIDAQSGVPGVAIGRIRDLPRGNLSGVLVELLFMPLIKKTDKKRCTYGDLIISTSKALLQLAGFTDKIKILLAWQNPLPSDDLPTIQGALLKQQMGVSKTTSLREIGYDPEEELALNQTEDALKLTAYTQGQGLPPSAQPQTGQPGQSMEGQQ